MDETSEMIGMLDEIPVVRKTLGEVYLLLPDGSRVPFPAPEEGKRYLVSGIVLARLPGRKDVFSSGNPLRDKEGKIIAWRCFCAAPLE